LHQSYLLVQLLRVLFNLVSAQNVHPSVFNFAIWTNLSASPSWYLSLDVVEVGLAWRQYDLSTIVKIHSCSTVDQQVAKAILGGVVNPLIDPDVCLWSLITEATSRERKARFAFHRLALRGLGTI